MGLWPISVSYTHLKRFQTASYGHTPFLWSETILAIIAGKGRSVKQIAQKILPKLHAYFCHMIQWIPGISGMNLLKCLHEKHRVFRLARAWFGICVALDLLFLKIFTRFLKKMWYNNHIRLLYFYFKHEPTAMCTYTMNATRSWYNVSKPTVWTHKKNPHGSKRLPPQSGNGFFRLVLNLWFNIDIFKKRRGFFREYRIQKIMADESGCLLYTS